MELFMLYLMSVAMRTFLFEVKFQYTRMKLREKHELFEIFLDCSFCNGFWTGFAGYFIAVPLITVDNVIVALAFAVLVGSTSYYLTLFTKKFK